LLTLNQSVRGFDNFATGHQSNLDEVKSKVTDAQWKNFEFYEGDIRNRDECAAAADSVDFVLHQAALGSVPRSIEDPVTTNDVNIGGFVNMLDASRRAGVKSFVYAASSSTYGDHPGLPKVEDQIGNPLSPYALTKYVNEMYCDIYARTYQMGCIGLRYFNVFGHRQDPLGPYAAVIPLWTKSLINGDTVFVNGDGSTTRDFCYVKNVVQANILATFCDKHGQPHVFNVAYGERNTLLKLHELLKESLAEQGIESQSQLEHRDFRAGDIRHSLADISKARNVLGYEPQYNLEAGIRETMPWYVSQFA
ncbi:MAG: NAD-dependent epimerase/dehydratase family protein, partial [Planctomycetota bacterium]